MNFKVIIKILLAGLFLTSCKNLKNTEIRDFANSEKKHMQMELLEPESIETELIVQKILDLPKLQWIYHSEIKERLPVKILDTELIEKNFNLYKFGQKVRILSPYELKEERISDYIEFHKLEFYSGSLQFELSYKTEAVGSSGTFIKENKKWKIIEYSVWEN